MPGCWADKDMTDPEFGELVQSELSGVTFVRNYIQLQFDPPPILNLYTPVSVEVGGQTFQMGRQGFSDTLIGQIGKVVIDVQIVPAASLDLRFADGSRVSASLKAADYVGAEAVLLSRRDRSSVVL
jgi:hypothetical protein